MEAEKGITFYPTAGEDIHLCPEDIQHHVRFFATGSFGGGRKTPTPVEVFTFTGGWGIVPDDYLDGFPSSSEYYQEIQAFKAANAVSTS